MIAQGPVQISQVVRHAVQFNARHWRNRPMSSDLMPQTVSNLFRLLDERQIDYVLVGGIALLSYVDGRNTEDIDLIVAAAALDRLPEIGLTSQDLYFARGQFQGLQIDFLLTTNPLFEQVRRRHTTVQRFDERDVTTATVEGLLLLKLYALPSLYREGNFARVGLYENDVATLLYYYQPDQEAILDELAQYLNASDLAKARSILLEINHRIQRFREMSLPSMSAEQRQYVTTRAVSSISRADSYEAIGEFWDAHDFTDYDDPAAPDVEFAIMNLDTLDIKSCCNQVPLAEESMVDDGH